MPNRKNDGKIDIYDLSMGDHILFGNITLEVISPFGFSGIPYGFGVLAHSHEAAPDNCVVAVDIRNRDQLYKFDKNIRVSYY